MQIIVDKNAGFCFGVKNAVEKAYELASTGEDNIYTYGELIHNDRVIGELDSLGLKCLKTLDECIEKNGKIIIRAHGISKMEKEELENIFDEVIDCTCPFVSNIHKLVQKAYQDGMQIIIVGDHSHAEVKGINGWCNNEAIITLSEEELENISTEKPLCIVAQTTQKQEIFKKIEKYCKKSFTNVSIHNTICCATKNRQESSSLLATQVEAVFVIGSRQSSNTNKLYELCKENNSSTYFIEGADDVNIDMLRGKTIFGLTAGASTPVKINKEVISKMEELNKNLNEDMAAMYEESLNNVLEMGQIVTGTVMQVTEDEITIDVQYKTDGFIKKNDYTWDKTLDLRDVVKVGDRIEAEVYLIKESEGIYLSVRSLMARKNWVKIEEAFNNNTTVDGVITSIVRGGGIVDVMGVRTFMPASHFDIRFVDDLTPYLNKEVTVNVIDFVPDKKKIVVSRKEQLKKERSVLEEAVWDKIKVGDKITGKVKRITPFGAFVDIGGIDGLIYITELAWTRIKTPEDVVAVDQEVEVLVLSADPETKKISLSLKQLTTNPWDIVAEKYAKDDIIEVKVVRFADFGAFVQLEPGIDGLVHISQISEKRVNKVADELKIGQTIKVKVLEINQETKKISLSIRAANIVESITADEIATAEVPAETVVEPVAEPAVETVAEPVTE